MADDTSANADPTKPRGPMHLGVPTGPVAIVALVAAAAIFVVACVISISTALKSFIRPVATEYEYVGVAPYRVAFDDLPGWHLDNVAEALPAFLRSCERINAADPDAPFNPLATEPLAEGPDLFGGRIGDWQPLCAEAAIIADRAYSDDRARSSAAREFFVSTFDPVVVTKRSIQTEVGGGSGRRSIDDPLGKVTGYFEPAFTASLAPTNRFSAPLYARPADLVSVDLGAFSGELKGKRVWGRLKREDTGLSLAPYPTHAEINAGALSDVASPIAFMDPNDLFFLQIQGSGRLILRSTGGRVTETRVGYDGANGRPYFAIGRALVERGALPLEKVSMQTIRNWLEAADEMDARALREMNPSFVFFRTLSNLPEPSLGPLGAEGVQLTGGRSAAIDPALYGYGAFLWIATRRNEDASFEGGLYVAQDTGGAIKGPVRADIFTGSGRTAGVLAGDMNLEGAIAALLPKQLAAAYPPLPRFPAAPISFFDDSES
ncbi:MAG: murein transglycosylase [Alphaproteobacteria bacterium]|nr:murein transglycosylase [Alphaproteobacteria bacterium]